jgi:hypothetical protein
VFQLGACSYPDQNFTSTSTVTVQGQGASTVVGDLDAHGAQNITFKNFNARDMFWVPLNGSSGGRLTSNMRTDGVNFTAGGIFLRGCQNCSFLNGSSGNRHDAYSQTIGTYSGVAVSRDILIQDWLMHDIDRRANTSGHTECLYIQESANVTLRRVHFARCEVFDLNIQDDVLGGPITGLSVQDSVFESTVFSGFYAVNQRAATNSEWLRNHFAQGFALQQGTVQGCGNLTNTGLTFPTTLRASC